MENVTHKNRRNKKHLFCLLGDTELKIDSEPDHAG